MDADVFLAPDKIKTRFTLDCQARPDTGRLVLDFDARCAGSVVEPFWADASADNMIRGLLGYRYSAA